MPPPSQASGNGTRHTKAVADTSYSAVPANEHEETEKARPPRANWLRRTTLYTWTPEVIAILLSTASLVAIVAVLYAYHGKTTPHLPYGITLNAIVSMLALISRSMLLYTVASSIGQLKWCWYQERKHKFSDLHVFDDASRGPWGSSSLLVSLHARSWASIGAIVTILALAFDPFVQQVLTFPAIDVEATGSPPSFPRARVVRNNQLSLDFRSAVSHSAWALPQQLSTQPDCPTGH
jgi:hypothetical protein